MAAPMSKMSIKLCRPGGFVHARLFPDLRFCTETTKGIKINWGSSSCRNESNNSKPTSVPNSRASATAIATATAGAGVGVGVGPPLSCAGRRAVGVGWYRGCSYKHASGASVTKMPLQMVQRRGMRGCGGARRQSERHPQGAEGEEKKPVQLMDFPQIIWPNIILTCKNYLYTYIIIKPYYDPYFALNDFLKGAKQALILVSQKISHGDTDELEGLVTQDAIDEIKRNVTAMTVKERHDLAIQMSDIYFCFPYQVGLMLDDDSDKRWVEITVCYHCLPGFENLRINDPTLSGLHEQREKIVVCNYRFIREYTKGVTGDWTINKVNHFKPTTAM